MISMRSVIAPPIIEIIKQTKFDYEINNQKNF